ncbi:MAG: hypothetical protein VX498_12865 [Myxococcota bacterium]|nr:hypothetical protein [Myxococcota bacterium]
MFSRRLSWFLASLLLAMAPAAPLGATTMEQLSLGELTWVADLVTEAVVEGNSTERVEGQAFLRTVTTLRLTRVVKGSQTEGEHVDVVVLGGRLGNEETRVASTPIFTPGERVLVFLEQRKGDWGVVGLSQGKFTLIEEVDTARDVVVKVRPPRGLSRFDEAAVQLPALRKYCDDLVREVETDVVEGAVPSYRAIPGLPAAKDLRFRAEARSKGQFIDPRWSELDSLKGGQR